jgi:hypothetical protein
MKRTIIALLLGVLLLFGACTLDTEEENSYSLDTQITLERYGMFTMPEYARQIITINSSGVLYETFYYNETKSGEAFTPQSEEEFRTLLSSLEKLDLSSLHEKYESSIPVADVGDGLITIQDGEESYSVEISPYISQGNPQEIEDLINAIQVSLENAEFPQRTLEMKYVGKQCIDEPWQVWYKEGNINYIQAPSQEQLILDYYASQDIEIKKIQTHETGPICRACGICADSEYFTINVSQGFVSELEAENWEIIN